MTRTPSHIGRRIAQVRAEQKLSMVELARRAQVSAKYIYYLENGYRKGTNIESLCRLSHALGLDLDELACQEQAA